MKLLATVVAILVLTVPAMAAPIISTVTPLGDGQRGSDRSGWGYGWETSSFDADANPSWSGHWYESSWYSGSSRTVYMQISLAAIPQDAEIQSAFLYLNILGCTGSGSSLSHRTDSTTATGVATHLLPGTVKVTDITGVPNGWLAIDVTSFIASDIARGHAWAVFSLPNKSYSSLTFSSADSGADVAPYLSVTAVPEPATMALLGLGAAALIRKRLQRRNANR